MTEILKPCPFCGGEAELSSGYDCYFVSCSLCKAQTEWDMYKEKAIELWNRRINDERKTVI